MAKSVDPERSKKARASKRRGKRGERLVIELLTKWWGAKFHRTPRSGGLRWGSQVAGVGGDIACEDPEFPFSTEVKNRERFEIEEFLNGKGKMWEWWSQCVGDAERLQKFPLMFVTKNYSPWYTVYSPPLVPVNRIGPSTEEEDIPCVYAEKDGIWLVLMRADNFFSCWDTTLIRRALGLGDGDA